MDFLKLKHHSLSDWDFKSGVGFHLNTARFISTPTSLSRPQTTTQGLWGWFYLKAAVKQNLPQGRWLNYYQVNHTTGRNMQIHFRVQALPTNEFPLNCYIIEVTGATWYLVRRLNGSDTTLFSGSLTYTWNTDQWYYHRLTFYEYLNASLDPILRVIFETEIAGSWVEQCNKDISSPLWSGSATNLIGMHVIGAAPTDRIWTDDTEVWEAT